MTLDEWRALRQRVKATHRDGEPDILAPPEAFSDRRADEALRDAYLPGHDPSAIRARRQHSGQPHQQQLLRVGERADERGVL